MPPRAGTFMYHSHFDEETQISSGVFGPIIKANGPYEVSASRNAVVVHRAELRGPKAVEAFTQAIRAAAEKARELRDSDRGNFGWRE